MYARVSLALLYLRKMGTTRRLLAEPQLYCMMRGGKKFALTAQSANEVWVATTEMSRQGIYVQVSCLVLSCLISWLFLFGILYKVDVGFSVSLQL